MFPATTFDQTHNLRPCHQGASSEPSRSVDWPTTRPRQPHHVPHWQWPPDVRIEASVSVVSEHHEVPSWHHRRSEGIAGPCAIFVFAASSPTLRRPPRARYSWQRVRGAAVDIQHAFSHGNVIACQGHHALLWCENVLHGVVGEREGGY